VFVGPQIRELTQEVKREGQLSEVGKASRKSLKKITTIFILQNHKKKIYLDTMADPEQSYKAKGGI
jgi:hypothetical protein